MFVSVIPEPSEGPFLFYFPRRLSVDSEINSLWSFDVGLITSPNGSIRESINSPNCTILGSWVLENFILVDKPFAKAMRIFETCVLANNNLCGKLVSSLESPTIFDKK